MFLVSFVFAVGLMFLIMQSLFQYTEIDVSQSGKNDEYLIMQSAFESINRTLVESVSCEGTKNGFRKEIEEMKNYFSSESIRTINSIGISYSLDCDYWNNVPPMEAPLNLTLSLTGPGIRAMGNYEMYHVI